MMQVKKTGAKVIGCLILLILLTSCGKTNEQDLVELKEDDYKSSRIVEIDLQPAEDQGLPAKSYTTEARLLAVGDVMMHGYQIIAGYDKETDTYNFDHFFTHVKDLLAEGDWVIANLETTTAGKEQKFTGYPMFNAPVEIIDALKEAGFNIVTHANNHTMDRYELGVIRTRDALEERGLYTTGTARTPEEREEILLVEKNGITLAVLAYTYGTNGIPIPNGKDYLVNLIDQEKIIEDIQKARELDADVVAVSLHFGIEYQLNPNQEQIELAHNLIEAGADIILGSHPHVVQPYEIIEMRDENGKIRKGVIIYSMGNFISAQVGVERNLGLIFGLTIRKTMPEGTIEIDDITVIPTWVHRYKSGGKDQFRVLPIEKVLENQDDELLTPQDYKNLESYLRQISDQVLKLVNKNDEIER